MLKARDYYNKLVTVKKDMSSLHDRAIKLKVSIYISHTATTIIIYIKLRIKIFYAFYYYFNIFRTSEKKIYHLALSYPFHFRDEH